MRIMRCACLTVFLVLLLLGCGKEQKKEVPREVNPPLNDDSMAILRQERDQNFFKLGKFIFKVQEITQSEFEKVPLFVPVTEEEIALEKDGEFVERSGDSLIFYTLNKNKVILKNDTAMDNMESFANYSFQGSIPDINHWLVKGSYWEYWDYILINKATGKKINAYSLPLISPGRDFIICGNLDLDAGFTFNGFQLFYIKNGEIEAPLELALEIWGPQNLKWAGPNELVCEKISMDEHHNETRSYIKLIIKR